MVDILQHTVTIINQTVESHPITKKHLTHSIHMSRLFIQTSLDHREQQTALYEVDNQQLMAVYRLSV